MDSSNDSNVKSLRPVANPVNVQVVTLLKKWLAKAEAGELLSVNLVGELTGGRWQTVGSINLDNRVSAAMLMELAMRKLSFASTVPQYDESNPVE